MIKIIVNQTTVPVICEKEKNELMKTNMVNADRIARLLLAIVFIALYFTNLVSGALGLILLITGSIFFLNNFTGFCPIYWILGFKGANQKEGVR